MTTLTLLVRASGSGQLRQIDDLLKAQFEELDVETKILGTAPSGWVQVSLSGEDEGIAKSYINKEIGACPTTIDNIENNSVFKGYISKVEANKEALAVDIGVFEPKIIRAMVSLAHLQAQLVDGKKISLKQTSELFSFVEGLPLSVKVVDMNWEETGFLQAELSTDQVERFRNWEESLLDRLIILHSSVSDVESVLERARLNRDVIGTESLGLFEHVLTCKLGTDAAGLIPRIGRYMKSARFVVFSPKKVVNFRVNKD